MYLMLNKVLNVIEISITLLYSLYKSTIIFIIPVEENRTHDFRKLLCILRKINSIVVKYPIENRLFSPQSSKNYEQKSSFSTTHRLFLVASFSHNGCDFKVKVL